MTDQPSYIARRQLLLANSVCAECRMAGAAGVTAADDDAAALLLITASPPVKRRRCRCHGAPYIPIIVLGAHRIRIVNAPIEI